MNIISFIAVATLMFSTSLSIRMKKNLSVSNDYSQNIIDNGNFANPPQNGGVAIYQNIQGWTAISGEIEIGNGNIYNPNWPAGTQVVEVDGNQNDVVGQTIKLKHHKKCHLDFDYASRINVPQFSNGLSVTWNGVTVANLETTDDYLIHHWCGELHAIAGNNQLNFVGLGISDALGTQFTNVVLKCVKYELKDEKKEYDQDCDDYKENDYDDFDNYDDYDEYDDYDDEYDDDYDDSNNHKHKRKHKHNHKQKKHTNPKVCHKHQKNHDKDFSHEHDHKNDHDNNDHKNDHDKDFGHDHDHKNDHDSVGNDHPYK